MGAKPTKPLCFSLRIISASFAHFAHLGGQSVMASKATKPTTAAKTSRPVTLKHLAATLAEEHQLTKRAGEALLGDLVGLITKHLKKGERIRIAGLGILQVRKRAARMGRNPATGEAIKIKASKKVAFRAAKGLKLAV
jgi:DNA-binding protein HU-beta